MKRCEKWPGNSVTADRFRMCAPHAPDHIAVVKFGTASI